MFGFWGGRAGVGTVPTQSLHDLARSVYDLACSYSNLAEWFINTYITGASWFAELWVSGFQPLRMQPDVRGHTLRNPKP